jgi:uncharacterized membrane protein
MHTLPIDHSRIQQAIAAAERLTSGEIRVVLYPRGVDDALATAQQEFLRLGMTHTRERNAVLVLVAPESHTFAVVGDQGVHARCGPHFWQDVAAHMEADFRAGKFTDGIVGAVKRTGDLLAAHFPRSPDDRNELPDDVVERGVVI